jgi:hypothetical protein
LNRVGWVGVERPVEGDDQRRAVVLLDHARDHRALQVGEGERDPGFQVLERGHKVP